MARQQMRVHLADPDFSYIKSRAERESRDLSETLAAIIWEHRFWSAMRARDEQQANTNSK